MFLDGFFEAPAFCQILLHFLVGKGSLIHEHHVVPIDVVLVFVEHLGQLRHGNRVEVPGFVGSELYFAHEGVGLGQQRLDAHRFFQVLLFGSDTVGLGLKFLEVRVPAHVLSGINYIRIND